MEQRVEPIDLLPHRGPARFITSVIEQRGGRIACNAVVPSECAYAIEGRVPSFVAIDVAAQAAAVLEIVEAGSALSKGGNPGVVVLARDVVCSPGSLGAGESLVVRVEREDAAPPLRSYRFRVQGETGASIEGIVGIHHGGPGRASDD